MSAECLLLKEKNLCVLDRRYNYYLSASDMIILSLKVNFITDEIPIGVKLLYFKTLG